MHFVLIVDSINKIFIAFILFFQGPPFPKVREQPYLALAKPRRGHLLGSKIGKIPKRERK